MRYPYRTCKSHGSPRIGTSRPQARDTTTPRGYTMKKMQKGFTLIELMIVVAIIAILAAIALPAYQDYTIRSQAAEGMSLAAAAKTAIAETYVNRGEWPADREEAGMSPTATDATGQFVESVEVTNGEIIVTYGENANTKIAGDTLIFTAYETADGGVAWQCSSVSNGPAPAGTAAAGPTAGTLEAKYAPAQCRA